MRAVSAAGVLRYAKAIVAAVGTAASVAASLGLQHEKYVAVVIAVLTVLGVYQVPNKPA